MQRLGFALILPCLSFLFCCSPKYEKALTATDTKEVILSEPDYAKSENWAAHPYKSDPSDLVPLPLQATHQYDSTVDVFFVHPTSYTDKTFRGWNASLSDSILNQKTDLSSIQYQASAFNEYRVFSPRYRQAYIDAYFTKDTVAAEKAFELAYNDIKSAFQYYLENYNQGRPIIIASHSQGTTHAKRLLKEFFDGQQLQKQLVAAYLLGMYIPRDFYSNIPVCYDSASTGCVVGWRTYRKGYTPEFVEKEKVLSIVTNPLTWSTDAPEAPSADNKGGVLLNFNKVIPHIVNASIHDGVLWVSKPKSLGNVFYTNKNYHIADYNLFYINVRNNAKERIACFQSIASNESK
jgi:hypothetical protein